MSAQRELVRKCEQLPYTIEKWFKKKYTMPTVSELKDMWNQYGYANVLGTLATIWSFDEAVSFFGNPGRSTD